MVFSMSRFQNSLVRAVTQAPHRISATELRRQLHLLPIRQHVDLKLGTAIITFRAMDSSERDGAEFQINALATWRIGSQCNCRQSSVALIARDTSVISFHTGVPGYLASELHHHHPPRALRLASASRLLRLSQTFLRSLGSGCLEQHRCCCS